MFTNHGTTTCTLTGYPGVAGLDAAGRQVAQARRTLVGYMGGANQVSTVTLAAGRAALAVVEGTAAGANGEACPGFKGLLVTAPDDTQSTRLDWSTDTCGDFQVHPVSG